MTDFEKELIHYIFYVQDTDDVNLSAEAICRKLYKYGLIDRGRGYWRPKKRPKYRWPVRAIRKAEQTEPNSSEKPNNCEHITEDGVTCAKYPACDDCPDNPLNKVKGSERLVKGSGQTDCQTCKWLSSYGYCVHRECKGYEPQTERSSE